MQGRRLAFADYLVPRPEPGGSDVMTMPEQIAVAPATLQSDHFGLLDRMGIVPKEEQQHPHSVPVTPATEFVICLPPVAVDGATAFSPRAQSGA